MAAAGGACDAYRVWLNHLNEIQLGSKRMISRSECVSVDKAVDLLWRGETIVVAAADVVALRVALQKVEEGPGSLGEVVNEHYVEGCNQ